MQNKALYRDLYNNQVNALALIGQSPLLYLSTEIRFPIGGERVTCHGPKLTNSLEDAKLTNSLG